MLPRLRKQMVNVLLSVFRPIRLSFVRIDFAKTQSSAMPVEGTFSTGRSEIGPQLKVFRTNTRLRRALHWVNVSKQSTFPDCLCESYDLQRSKSIRLLRGWRLH